MSEIKVVASILGKFTPQELNSLIPELINIEWNDVVDVIIEHRLCLQTTYIVRAVLHICQLKNLSKEEWMELINKLKFYEVITKFKLVWKCVKLEDQIDEFPHVNDLEQKIQHVFKSEAKDCDVLIYEDDPLIYVMCTEIHKTKRNSLKYSPFYLVIHTNLAEQYIFYTSTSSHRSVQLNLICKALGYDGCSSVSLTGMDVKNMFMIIERNQNGTQENPDFDPVRVVKEDGVVDFTLGIERSRYAEQVFPGVSNLNTFNVHANSPWKGTDADSDDDDDDDEVFTSITFTTKKGFSIENAFQELVKSGMVKFPLPPWMINLKNTPTNEVSLLESSDDRD